MEVTAYVRFRQGVVGESSRVVHLVKVTGDFDVTKVPGALRALCGQAFVPGEAEALPKLSGMPCVVCMSLAPNPDADAVPIQQKPPLPHRDPRDFLFRISG